MTEIIFKNQLPAGIFGSGGARTEGDEFTGRVRSVKNAFAPSLKVAFSWPYT